MGHNLVGKVLRNRKTGKAYKVLRLHYEGSMAYIYTARDEHMRTEVILKAIKYVQANPEETIPRRRKEALWEAKLLMQIHDLLSSAVPQVIDILLAPSQDSWIREVEGGKWVQGEPYLVLEKITGKNLSELDLPLSLEGALSIGLNIALFLDLLHRTGYIYQSLTPENVILGDDGWNVTMLDLDSAAPLNPDKVSQIELTEWKRRFLPPQIFASPQTDIYSLGALLYYLLTGMPPERPQPDFEHYLFQNLPLGARELIQRCLGHKDKPLSSAGTVASHLEALLGIRKIPIVSLGGEEEQAFSIPAGTLLHNGQYKILRGLSSGGQGRVYVAENLVIGCKVLLKTPLYPRELADLPPKEQQVWVEDTHKIFEVEAKMLAHFHTLSSIVPQPLDFFWDKTYESTGHLQLSKPLTEVPYLVIEFIQGHTLDVTAKLTAEEALRIADRLCHIIGLFHRENYIYQDLKLSNVMIDERGQNIYLIDLGSLCAVNPKTGAPDKWSVTYGTYTPGYRAPEWVFGARYCDKRSDIYTIGATLWALLSGKSPADYFRQWEKHYYDQRRRGLIGEKTLNRKLLEAESPRLPLRDLGLSEEEKRAGVEELVAKALAPDPEKRYPDVESMRAHIQKVLQCLRP